MGMNVALRAGVGVFPPCAADAAGPFDYRERGETCFLERDTHAESGHPGAEDNDARGSVCVVVLPGGEVNAFQFVLIAFELTTFRAVMLAYVLWARPFVHDLGSPRDFSDDFLSQS